MSLFISVQNTLPKIFNSPFHTPFNWDISTGEIWSVIGPNGSGKSLLAKMIAGTQELREGTIKYSFCTLPNIDEIQKSVRIISFDTVYGLANYRDSYYQMRFNNPDVDVAPTVQSVFHLEEVDTEEAREAIEKLNVQKLMDRQLVQLSSGELRKLLIVKLLTEKPRMLILDHPYVGLDALSREHLNEIFPHLVQHGIQLVFLVSSVRDLPPCTTHVLEIDNCRRISESHISNYKETQRPIPDQIPALPWEDWAADTDTRYEVTVRMEDVKINYGERVVCQHIDWEVRKGEKWALLGPNGSGKSTLLSFVSADNPKAYTQNLTLFGRKRGTGETIWDIKKRIGFTSSEMHLYYRHDITCLVVVESGFYDSVGLYEKCNEQKALMAGRLLMALGLGAIKDRRFHEVSTGQQRLVLVARAMVKNPELLILDEPFQGLDDTARHRALQLIDSFCEQPDKALIFVTHQKDEIPKCVDKTFALQENSMNGAKQPKTHR